jgi:PAS domain S-box-containing protein
MARTVSRSLAQLTAIIDSVPTAIIMVDEHGKIDLVNAQAERLFGYTADELHGEMIDTLVPSRFRSGHPELRAGFIKDPGARQMGAGRDLFGLHKDGTEFPVEICLNPIRTEEGLFVVSAIVDIAERKRLEARFRATVESAPTAIVMIDEAGTIVLVNAEVERLFGYEREELLRQKVEVLIPDRFRSKHPGLRSQYFASPEARRMGAGRDLPGLRKDGSEFSIEIGLSPVRTEEGLFVLAAVVDVSERLRQAEALRHANEALERSNIELQRFAYVASHDLQTPMRSIASFVGLLQSTYADRFDAQANDWICRTVQSVRDLQTLVQDLLAYSRVDAQAHPFQPVSLREVIDHAVSLLDASVRESGAEITCGELPDVLGERTQLVQLLLNLIGNAIKYRGKEPLSIHISAEKKGNEWIFAVRDNGIGIAPKHHQRIFEIFQRLHDAKEYPGTGIGLAVCRRVVHRHGGRIWVESESGRGSVFYFTIPEGAVNPS